jgi:hypothetical protein
LSASGSSTFLKFSPFAIPRPPETMILAAVSSGLSDLETSRDTKLDSPLSFPGARFSIGQEAEDETASNAVVRTVMTLIGSFDFTVASALPA